MLTGVPVRVDGGTLLKQVYCGVQRVENDDIFPENVVANDAGIFYNVSLCL